MSGVTVDRKGGFVTVFVNPKVYPLDVVYSAAYVFLDRAYVILDQGDGKTLVRMKPKGKEDLDKLGMEFHNELVNYANYLKRMKDNSDVVRIIVQRALLSADSSLTNEMREGVKEAEEKEIETLIKELEEEGDEELKEVVKELKDDKKK